MSKRRRNISTSASSAPASGAVSGERLRPLWLGGTAALFVATPLVPSEAPAAGLGVSLLMAWLVLFAAMAVAGAIQPRLQLRFGSTDLAMWVFIALHTTSALVLADAGQPRQTLNMLWQWVGFGAAFFLARQVVRTPRESRALVAVMIALAVCLSMHGFYQYFHSMPAARRAYEADPEGKLANAGLVAPEHSVAREQFENRLYSTEPMATFTLANSLAGFLAPWLLCAIGIAGLNRAQLARQPPLAAAAGASVLLVAGCFVLTKSRSATLAMLVGAALLVVYGRRRGWRPGWKSAVAAAGLFALVVALAVLVGGFDLLVLTESSKSLLYRIQYWRASLAMIADSPWLGCGPGNFQQSYTAFKLPEASETIKDPHNLVFEIWSTAGTPAMLAFLAIFISFAFRIRHGLSASDAEPPPGQSAESGSVRALYWGALAGVPLGFVAGLVVGYPPDTALLLVGLPLAAAVVFAWHAWVREGRLPIVVPLAAISVMLINLLAAGGISFAGVSMSLWLLLAMALNLSGGTRVGALSARSAAALAGTAVVITFLFWYSTFVPVLAVSTKLAQARDAQRRGQFLEAEQTLLAAAAADRYSVEPWQALAELRLAMWLDGQDASREAAFAAAARETLNHHPRSWYAHQTHGDWYLRAYRAIDEPRLLDEAIAGYQRAVELYPHHSFGHAQLAWALQIAGRFEASSREAEAAWRLDQLNPHREQKLAERAVFDVPRRIESQRSNPPATMNAEQLMQLLRMTPDS